MAAGLWHTGGTLLKAGHDSGTLLREVFRRLSFTLRQINSGCRNGGVGAVSSSTSARPKVTAPWPASLSPLNQSLPLDMNRTSVSARPAPAGARVKGKRATRDHFYRPDPRPLRPRHAETMSTDAENNSLKKNTFKKNETAWPAERKGFCVLSEFKIKISCLLCVT